MSDTLVVPDLSDLNVPVDQAHIESIARFHVQQGEALPEFVDTLAGLGYPFDDLNERAGKVLAGVQKIDAGPAVEADVPVDLAARRAARTDVATHAAKLADGINGIRRTARTAQRRVAAAHG